LKIYTFLFSFACAVFAFTLTGCSSRMSAAVEGVRKIVSPGTEADTVVLRPDVTYLRVTVQRHVALMGLLAVEPHMNGRIEVWIGAGGEVLRLQNGRVIGMSGLPVEWRQVSLPAFPAWNAIAGANTSHDWTRVRDVMPGYRAGIRDHLTLRRIPVPTRSEIRGYEPASLMWFDERLTSTAGPAALPPTQYAVEHEDGKETVVYSRQCLAADVCFTWQHWYIALQQAALKVSKP
jgi:hypothetical protein